MSGRPSTSSATTQRVILGTSVLVLPYHNPVELAKYTATLDQMSGGRVTLGVGVGAMAPEFDALGIPLKQRGSLTNVCIAIMKEPGSSLVHSSFITAMHSLVKEARSPMGIPRA